MLISRLTSASFPARSILAAELLTFPFPRVLHGAMLEAEGSTGSPAVSARDESGDDMRKKA